MRTLVYHRMTMNLQCDTALQMANVTLGYMRQGIYSGNREVLMLVLIPPGILCSVLASNGQVRCTQSKKGTDGLVE